MTLLLNLLHITFLVVGVIFSSYLAYSSVGYHFAGNTQSGQALNVLTLILLVYTVRHSYLYMNYGLEIPKLLTFPIIYIALGMTLDIAMGSVVELWSPVTTWIEAQLEIAIIWLIILVFVLAVLSSEY